MESAPGVLPVDRLARAVRSRVDRLLRPYQPARARADRRAFLARALLDPPVRPSAPPGEGAGARARARELAPLLQPQGMGGVRARRSRAVAQVARRARELGLQG